MKLLTHPVFILCVLLFGLNQSMEKVGVYIWPLHTHLDDLLCLPIVLTLILIAQRLYFKNAHYTHPKRHLLIALLLFSVVFEWMLPMLSGRYTSDPLDIAAYTVGALLFQVTINKPAPLVTNN